MLNRKMRIMLVVPCMLALMVGTAWATSPYDLPYTVQWNFIIGNPATVDTAYVCKESPDGTVWITTGGPTVIWGNPTSAYGAALSTGYGQISPNGLIHQGNDIPVVPGMTGYNQGYSPTVAFAGTDPTAYIAYNGGNPNLWSDATPADTVSHSGVVTSFSVTSFAGMTPVDYNGLPNVTLPIPNAAGLDPTKKFTFDMLSTTYYMGSAHQTVMGSDCSYYIATGNQGSDPNNAPDMFTVGDFSGPYNNYKPAIGRFSADGLTRYGPANHPSCSGRSMFTDIDLNETAGKVYASGYGYTQGSAIMNFFDADGPGPIASIPLNSATPDNNKGFAVVYDTTSWAVLQTVVWESTRGGDIIADIMATPDGGFVICGQTKGDLGTGVNPAPGTNDGYIQKYDASGTLVWDYQTQTSFVDTFGDMSLDEDGNIYISGNETGASPNVILLKFKSSDGTLVWKTVIDNAGTNDSQRDNSSIDKTAIYVLSVNNTTTGTPWSNTISYVPTGTGEILLQKMSPGDFNSDGRVDFTDVQLAGTSANALPGGGAGVDTYDFDGDGKSDYRDVRYMITKVMDRVVGDIHPGAAFDIPGDVDNADIGKVIGSYNTSSGTGRVYFDGDMDFDGDVDNADIGFVAGAFTGALAGNLTDSGSLADLIYDPATGNVKVDASEAGGGVVTSFQLETAAGTFIPANYVGPTGGTFGGFLKDVTKKTIADSDLTFVGFSGIHDFGNIFPTGMTLEELEAFLKTAVYTGAIGIQQQQFDLVIPEPATMALLGLGGLGLLGRRRRK